MRHPDPGTLSEPGLAIYRFGAPLFYANASRFSDEIRGLAGASPSQVRWLVIDAEAITNIDYTAARMVRDLHGQLRRESVELAFARVAPSLRADLVRHRLVEVIGPDRVFLRLHDALEAFAASMEATPAGNQERPAGSGGSSA
jgi:MFS superfamily sulfate permease-like transporter